MLVSGNILMMQAKEEYGLKECQAMLMAPL
jgi:hypothetical protein